ncbi:MAG TPA: glycosyltransferase family 39 protein [Bryobacteraceae bacterium]
MPSANRAKSGRLVILARVDTLASAIENSGIWPLAIFLAIYFPLTAFLASRKLMWDDEFYTLYVSRAGSLSEILKPLATGAEQHPPLFLLLVHQIMAVFGPSHLTLRLAAIFGYGLFCICLFFLLRNRTSTLWAMIGMLLPLVAGPAYYYAIEARGYGLMLGFCALALLSWQQAATLEKRFGWLCLLFCALAMAVESHYYGILFLIPLGLGELTRTYLHKRLDALIWLAFCGAAVPLLVFLSTIRHTRQYSAHFWAIPYWSKVLEFYPSFLVTPITIFLFSVLVIVYFIAGLWPAEWRFSLPEERAATSGLPAWEIVTWIGIVAMPLWAMVLAKFVTHGYTERYAISALIGAFLVICHTGFQVAPRIRMLPFTLCVILVLLFGLQGILVYRSQSIALSALVENMKVLAPYTAEPAVISDSAVFHRISFYARREFQRNFAHLCDSAVAVKYLGHDDQSLLDLRPWFPLNTVERARYENEHSEFLTYGTVNEWNWITFFFTAPTYKTSLLARNGTRLLLHIERVAPIPASPQEILHGAAGESLFARMRTSGPSLCEEWFPGDRLCTAVRQKSAATNSYPNYRNPPSR